MGKGAFIRIQNKSSHTLKLSIAYLQRVDDIGLDNLQGELAPGEQFPKEGQSLPEPSATPGKYEYMEGDVERRWHKDGKFTLEARTEDGKLAAVEFMVDKSAWWCRGHKFDDGGVVMCTDIDEDEHFRTEVRIFDAITEASWMEHLEEYIADKPLCRVALPGTHDSATYRFAKDLGAAPDSDLTQKIQDTLEGGPKIFRKIGSKINDAILDQVYERMCKCQELTIKQQLEEGVRYLDLRLGFHEESGQFYSCHGVFCVDMKEVVQEINGFLDAHPKEIVICDFNHLYGMTGKHDEFTDMVLEMLGDKVADIDHVKPNSTYSEFLEKNARAIVIYHDGMTSKESEGRLWSRGWILSPWPQANDSEDLYDKLKENITNRKLNKFFVLQGILTPDGELIKEEVMANRGDMSIKNIASKVSCRVVDWVDDEWKDMTHNVVIVDFFSDCSMVQAILNLNRTHKDA